MLLLSNLTEEIIMIIAKFSDSKSLKNLFLCHKEYSQIYLNEKLWINKLECSFGYDYPAFGPESYENLSAFEHFMWSLKVPTIVDKIFLDLVFPDDEKLVYDAKQIIVDHIVIAGPNRYMYHDALETAEELICNIIQDDCPEFEWTEDIFDYEKMDKFFDMLKLPNIKSLIYDEDGKKL